MRRKKTIHLKNYSCIFTMILATNAYRVTYNIHKKANDLETLHKKVKNNNFEGMGITTDMNQYYLLLNLTYPISHNTIAHELWHLTNLILSDRSIVEDEDHENGAWLMGYLAEETYKFLEEKKINII